MSNVIPFNQPKKQLPTCAFCKKPVTRGKFIQESPDKPAICFACVAKCNELLKND